MNRRINNLILTGMLLIITFFGISGCSGSGYAKPDKDIIVCQVIASWEKEAADIILDLPGQADYETEQSQQSQDLDNASFVKVKDYIPDIWIDLKYSTTENFTGSVIYDFTEAYLRYGTVKKLKNVQDEVKQSGFSLKIWDAFRPISAQFKLWEICPDPQYVANPNTGFSSHSKGNTVDIALVNEDGTEIELPTGFDDFSARADRDYSDCSNEAAVHAQYLENVMQKNGFVPYTGEWWHFTDEDPYPVEEMFLPLTNRY